MASPRSTPTANPKAERLKDLMPFKMAAVVLTNPGLGSPKLSERNWFNRWMASLAPSTHCLSLVTRRLASSMAMVSFQALVWACSGRIPCSS